MKTTSTPTSLILLAVMVATGCSGSASAQSLGRQRVHPRGVDGAILERTVEVKIDAQGRQRLREHKVWEILTDHAMDHHSDPAVWFDRDRQSLDVAAARTTMLDGRVVETPANGRNELLPRALIAAPWYGSIRRTVITHVGVEMGARAELDYSITDREPTSWSAGGVVPVAGPLPAAKTRISIELAQGTLRSACIRCSGQAEVLEQSGGLGHTYDFPDLEPLNTYELGHRVGVNTWPSRLVPQVIYSAAEGWPTEVRGLAERVDQAAAVTEPLRERAAELTRDESTTLGRIEALQAFVAGSVDTIRLNLWRLGYDPASAEEVLAQSCGSVLEKGVLLAALLRSLNIEAHLALSTTDSRIAADVPWLGQLDQVWVVAPSTGAGELWMPLDRRLLLSRAALPGESWAVRLDRPSAPARLAPADPEASSSRLIASLRVSGEGELNGQLRLTAGGAVNPYFDLRAGDRSGTSPLSGAAGALGLEISRGSAEVASFGTTGITVEGRLEGTRATEADGTILTLPLIWSPPGGLDRLDLREGRSTPLILPGPQLHNVRITFEIPSGWQVIGQPSSVEIRHGSGHLIQRVSVEDGRVEIERELVLRHRLVEPEEYPQIREILVASARRSGEVIILGRAD